MTGQFVDGFNLFGRCLGLKSKFDFGDGATTLRLGPLHGEMRQLVNLRLRDFQHPATELSKVGIGVRVDTQGCAQTDYIDFPYRLPPMQAKRPFLIELERIG